MPLIRIPSEDAGVEVLIYKEEAPAVALHILEQCGYTGGDLYSINTPDGAIRVLRRYVADQAKEDEQLTFEAKELWASFRGSRTAPEWGQIDADIRGYWRAAAKKARELHGGAK